MKTDPTTEPVAVTQAAREAAAKIAEMVDGLDLGGNDVAAIRQGIWDNDQGEMGEFVRYIARLTHSPAAERDVVARAIRDCPGAVGFSYESWCEQAADAVIAAIRARPAVPDAVRQDQGK